VTAPTVEYPDAQRVVPERVLDKLCETPGLVYREPARLPINPRDRRMLDSPAEWLRRARSDRHN
jgi:hypothetical protein